MAERQHKKALLYFYTRLLSVFFRLVDIEKAAVKFLFLLLLEEQDLFLIVGDYWKLNISFY